MSKRTFTARVAGTDYEIPTSFGILNEAAEASGVSVIEAVANGQYGYVVQGVIYAGLRRQGITEIDGAELTYELVGEVCDFREATGNMIAFMRAMAPESSEALEETKKSSKNAPAEDPKQA